MTAIDRGLVAETAVTRLVVPGTNELVTFERERPSRRLLAIEAEGRRYLTTEADGTAVWDAGLVRVRESRAPGGLRRRVRTRHGQWTETYEWDGQGRLSHVDGVDVRRDHLGRVVACTPGGDDPAGDGHRWIYGYTGWGLTVVDGPAGVRHLTRGGDGRVLAWRDGAGGPRHEVCYDQPAFPAATHHRDDAGRLWAVTDDDGSVRSTWLWDGFRCLARVDGPLGEPLATVFSLDPSGTPVRVCGRDRDDRVPRDAFGEGLLHRPGVPGLYGGAVHDGLVHLPWRVLDPVIASFCSPDPLPLEDDPSGAYAVCRNDPIGRADPTGGVSAGLVISDLTWSLQNNLLSFFGIDWFFNFFGSLVTGFQLGDFASSEGLTSSDRLGSFGLRRDGIIGAITGGRAFTTAHIVWSPAAEFEELQRGRVIDPAGDFEPTLYGTLLVARPEGETAFLLRGTRNRGGVAAADDARLWARVGGAAAPAVPGAVVPRFPAGGFHLDMAPLGILGPRACPLTEVAPAGGVAVGSLEARATIDFPDPPAAPGVGGQVLLADAGGDLLLTTVVSSTRDGGRTLVRLEDDAPAIGPAGVTATQIDPAPASSENRPAEPAVPNAFSARGAAAAYAPDDLLRLTDSGGGGVTLARVARLEARLPLDRPLPAAMTPPLSVSATTVAPTALHPLRRNATTVEFTTGPVPPIGAAAVVSGNGQTLPVLVIASGPTQVQVDIDITALSAQDAAVDWFPVTTGSTLGQRADPPEAEARITYTPAQPGAAPDGSVGTVVVRVDAGAVAAVRRVTGAPAHDAVVVERAIAGAGPWQVDRLRRLPGTGDVTGLTITQAAALVARPAALVDGADALMLQRLTGDPPAPAGGGPQLTGMAVAGTSATATVALADLNPRPTVGEVVLVGPVGATSQPALVTEVRVTPTFDRDLTLEADGLSVVPLVRQGHAWTAARLGDRQVVLNPQARTGAAASVPVEFPRIGVGETVEVNFADAGTTTTGHYRVTTVAGTTLDLEGEPAIPATATAVRVIRRVPGDPANGGVLLGRDGDRVGANPTRRAAFSVWDPAAFPEDLVVGIVSGDRTTPAVVVDVDQDVELTLLADGGLPAGPIDVDVPTVARTGFAVRFVRDGDTLLVTDPLDGLATAPGETLAVVPFRASDRRADAGRLHAGSLLIPEDQGIEVDRRQSLIDHELTHTLQYARFGPLWFNCFPMLALELPIELASNTELPDYSRFLAGTLSAQPAGGRWELRIPDRQGVTFTKNDKVQVSQGGQFSTVDVVEATAERLVVRTKGGAVPPTGDVQVRRRNNLPVADGVFDVFQLLTHGGLLNVSYSLTWGGILWLLSKGVYGIYRAIKGTGDLHVVTVAAEGRELVLTTEEGRRAVQSGMRVIVRRGHDSVVRTVESRAGDVLTLDQRVTYTADVKISPYSFHDPGSAFDWLDYHPATIPDVANPAVLELTPVGGSELALAPLDRVEVAYRGVHARTTVTSVTGQRVELEDPVPVRNGEQTARVAKIGERDPMGDLDSTLLTGMGMGWLKWVFDPYGQLQVGLRPENRWWNLTARIVRYTLGTQMWSLAPPVFGYVWWSRLFLGADEHRAAIEQEASEESGDLYSPLGRLNGQSTGDGFARRRMVVGDVVSYRYWPRQRGATLVTTREQAAPGVHVNRADLRLMPHVVTTAAAADPNGTAQTDATAAGGPGRSLPDLVAQKNTPDPTGLVPAVTNPVSFQPSDRGLVPESPTNQRCLAAYVAFTRPGTHRVTTQNGIVGDDRAVDLHADERQPLFFDLTATDVDVRIGGQPVAEGATVDLVQLQEAPVVVTPADGRQYRVTVPRPAGPLIRLNAAGALAAQTSTGTEPVEVSRFYPVSPSGGYADGGLSRFGLHLGGEVHIAVRQFSVRVLNTVPLRATADPAAAAVAVLAQGVTGFVLVPAAIADPLRLTSFAGAPPTAGGPAVTITQVASPSPAASAFVAGGGAVFQVSFADAPAVVAPVAVVLTVTVGVAGGGTADLTCSFDLTP